MCRVYSVPFLLKMKIIVSRCLEFDLMVFTWAGPKKCDCSWLAVSTGVASNFALKPFIGGECWLKGSGGAIGGTGGACAPRSAPGRAPRAIPTGCEVGCPSEGPTRCSGDFAERLACRALRLPMPARALAGAGEEACRLRGREAGVPMSGLVVGRLAERPVAVEMLAFIPARVRRRALATCPSGWRAELCAC